MNEGSAGGGVLIRDVLRLYAAGIIKDEGENKAVAQQTGTIDLVTKDCRPAKELTQERKAK